MDGRMDGLVMESNPTSVLNRFSHICLIAFEFHNNNYFPISEIDLFTGPGEGWTFN